jgi:hypothetical protein
LKTDLLATTGVICAIDALHVLREDLDVQTLDLVVCQQPVAGDPRILVASARARLHTSPPRSDRILDVVGVDVPEHVRREH